VNEFRLRRPTGARAIEKDADWAGNAALLPSIFSVAADLGFRPPSPEHLTMTQHPEDTRLATAAPTDVTLYTRPGCHLCEDAKEAIAQLLEEMGARLREVNISNDAVLEARYGTDIPVIFIGGRKAAKHRVDVKKFRRQLLESQRG
jgi:glutaredoxin